MAQQDGSTTTPPGQPGTQTGDFRDHEAVLVNHDMINNGANVTSNAALDSDVINNSNAMDNTVVDFLPQQLIPHSTGKTDQLRSGKFNNHIHRQ